MIKIKASCIKNGLDAFFNERGLRAEHVKGFINNYPDAYVYVDDPNAVCCIAATHGESERSFFYLDCLNESYVDRLASLIDEKEYVSFGGVDMNVGNAIKARFSKEIYWENPCDLFYYPKSSVVEVSPETGVVSSVDVKDAEFIDENYTYRGEDSIDRITEDILTRPSAAVYIEGKIASWSLIHEDNSMGVMFTLPQFRGLGLAQSVTSRLIKKVLDGGGVPFVHIVVNNLASKRLSARCGMKFSHCVNWLGVRTIDNK